MPKSLRDGVRSSTGLEYIGKFVFRNLHVSLRSFATEIQIDETDKTAKCVYYIKNGRKHYFKARREIIHSGKTIYTPQLLLLSGIGPSSHLKEKNIPVKADLPVEKKNARPFVYTTVVTYQPKFKQHDS